ncbi:Fe3+-hydroxamate ABC transporter substrate-binding protein [Tumebacillus algifaecis]|uniref:Fe3+-hydroxamate ABC transporter substrate-binding protein n=1 Tax=Tumebacillus algifaecis TaxID=1214604 RepID=A0A223CXE7_9BACL|nr:ABC transporter substrate-binding protein [Tumebacillus algifaecis]ASS73971.1 Fe3+-hydroxamate ABC transporter substrate-binding protein [Tumebacillus algifaecis]
MKWNKKSFLVSTLSIIFAFTLTACGNTDNSQTGSEVQQAPQGQLEPITLTNMGNTLTFADVPKKAVSLNQHATEIMLALGLQESMVGTAYLDDQIEPEFQDAYSKIPVLSKEYPSKEAFFAVEPDFAYAGWKSAFTEQSLGTVKDLNEAGIKTYIQESSNMTEPTLEDVYKDIQNIGRIFRVEPRANELIGKMKQEIEQTKQQIGDVKNPLKIFVYDSGEDKAFTAANNYMTHLIEIAGGKNIFDDIKKSWAEVSWEEVVHRDPDVIVIVDYGEQSADQKQKLLLSKKELADIPAIKNKRFIVLPLSAAAEGIRAPHALQILAKGMYPDRIKE